MKNGFSLLEILTIIIILGIIALIAIPTISNILNDVNKNAFKNSVINIDKKIQDKCNIEHSKNIAIKSIYDFSTNIKNELDIKGDLPNKGKIIIDNDCNTIINVSNNYYCVIKQSIYEEIKVDELKNCS